MKSVRTLVVVSDLHAGSRLGLAPARIKLDDGGYYVPSKEQQVLKSWWDEFWTEFVPRETKGEPYEVVCNGDAVEGVPHGSVAHVSAIMDEHCWAAVDLLRPVVAAPQCSGYWHIRGTEAHVGKSAELEERVARELGSGPPSASRSRAPGCRARRSAASSSAAWTGICSRSPS